jgi:hypothetical protein
MLRQLNIFSVTGDAIQETMKMNVPSWIADQEDL